MNNHIHCDCETVMARISSRVLSKSLLPNGALMFCDYLGPHNTTWIGERTRSVGLLRVEDRQYHISDSANKKRDAEFERNLVGINTLPL